MKTKPEYFADKTRRIMETQGMTTMAFEQKTGIDRAFFYRRRTKRHHRATVLAIAYVLGYTAEELVAGTDMEEEWEAIE